MESRSIMLLASVLLATFLVANVAAEELNLLNLFSNDKYEAMEVAEKTPVSDQHSSNATNQPTKLSI